MIMIAALTVTGLLVSAIAADDLKAAL